MLTLLARLLMWQDASPAQDSTDFRAMTLSIKSATAHLIVDEPLSVLVTVANPTERSLTASFFLAPNASSLRVLVARDQGSFEEFRHSGWDPALVVGPPVTLEAKQSRVARRIVSQGEGCVFDRPGLYRVMAELQDGNGTVLTSNELAIKVEKTPDAEVAAWTLLRERKLLGVLGVDAEEYGTAANLDGLQKLVEQHPKSAFAPTARLAIVTLTLRGALACKKVDQRVESLNSVLAIAATARETCPKDLLADLIWAELRATICLRKHDDAVKLLASFKEASIAHPRRSELPALEDLVEHLRPK